MRIRLGHLHHRGYGSYGNSIFFYASEWKAEFEGSNIEHLASDRFMQIEKERYQPLHPSMASTVRNTLHPILHMRMVEVFDLKICVNEAVEMI